jgi:hypothetical protein
MSRSRRYDWTDSSEARWALAIAWAWAVESGHVPPLGDAAAAVRADAQLERGARRTPESEAQAAWAVIAAGLESRSEWHKFARHAGSGVRGVARVLHLDAERRGRPVPPTWWTDAGARPLPDGRWEAVVGWHGTIQQAGEWPTREAALDALRALRPGARITIYETAHPYGGMNLSPAPRS